MAAEPERGPVDPASSGVPVERGKEDQPSVPAQWLVEPDHLTLADHVDRLAGDFELVTLLAFAGYAGRDWDYFATELAKYGMAVIGGWMRRGMIFDRCQMRGYGGLPALSRPFTDDEVEELCNETVAKALVHFREDVLMKHRWDHRKGATLRTFFIGQCLIRFANIYRRWWANESRNTCALTDQLDLLETSRSHVEGPESQALDRAVVNDAMASIKDPRVRAAMILIAGGRSQAEIAAELAISEKTVERMLANERIRLRRRQVA
jgi:DNA-directed RNA polymerase specialized sigma24 family protein